MKKVLVLAAVLSLVGAASAAEINLFWSTTGISDAGLMYSTALTNFTPAFVNPTPIDNNTLQAGSYDLFLWGTFPADWTDYQIYGMDNKFQGDATHTTNVAYRQRWGGPASAKRWDGSAGILLDGVLAAVTASGIYDNLSVPNLILANGQFLLGAAHVTGVAGQTFTVALDTAADGLGINCRDANGVDVVPDPTVTPATVTFIPVPEPASILLALAGLLLRRR